MNNLIKAPADENARKWWNSVASQSRDLSANANESPLVSARRMREWADSRANDSNPEWAALVSQARASAAAVVQANRPRPV